MSHAAQQRKIFHLWWHPHNFGCCTDRNIEQLEEICMHFNYLRQQYNYKNTFMSDL